ncbi:MAG: hypothetical protein ABI625_24560, partial [bacterium]
AEAANAHQLNQGDAGEVGLWSATTDFHDDTDLPDNAVGLVAKRKRFMRLVQRFALAAVMLCPLDNVIAQRSTPADSVADSVSSVTPREPRPRGRRFYTGISWGSESQFNPLSELINEGFNDLVIESSDMRLFNQPYAASWKNLKHNLLHVRASFKQYGTRRAIRNELLPLTGFDGGQWFPNYTDHFIGNGMVSVRLEEWYAQHGYPAPLALSVLTMMAAHVTNEVIERPRYWSLDPLADLLVFDPLGMVLFRSDVVQRVFSGPVRLTNWAGQPMIVAPDGRLENASEEFKFTFALPRTSRVQGFVMTGLNVLGGATYTAASGRALSLGIGRGSDVVQLTDSTSDVRTVRLGARAGVFYDREGSLLASLVYDGSRNGLVKLNIYPGIVRVRGTSPGFWLDVRRNGLRFGLAAPFGMGVAYGTVQPK